jgi:tRNA A37 threonylcarbamoyladenosine synthetase subunit TsaC/SUA5/YrdC
VHPGERQIQARDLKIRQRESSKDVILSAQKIKYLQELKKRKCSNAHIRTVIITAESLELLDEFWSLITAATNS